MPYFYYRNCSEKLGLVCIPLGWGLDSHLRLGGVCDSKNSRIQISPLCLQHWIRIVLESHCYWDSLSPPGRKFWKLWAQDFRSFSDAYWPPCVPLQRPRSESDASQRVLDAPGLTGTCRQDPSAWDLTAGTFLKASRSQAGREAASLIPATLYLGCCLWGPLWPSWWWSTCPARGTWPQSPGCPLWSGCLSTSFHPARSWSVPPAAGSPCCSPVSDSGAPGMSSPAAPWD